LTQQDTEKLQAAKQHVLSYCRAFDSAEDQELGAVLRQYCSENYLWRGLHPFHEQHGTDAVMNKFWSPLRRAFTALQRRVDVFIAGNNTIRDSDTDPSPPLSDDEKATGVWTCQMGHFMGLMDQPWLDIPATGRIAFIRFAEFHKVIGNEIVESALFFDLINVMRQAGQYPLPPGTGVSFLYPGPATGDGLLYDAHPPEQGQATLQLINRMIDDLNKANETAAQNNDNRVPRGVLARSWDEQMIWYGPDGIGATYTIDRYQHQHQYPFRFNLTGKTFNGHVARFAEGHYGCFFGWPNLTNTSSGGFLGLPASNIPADMRVVDVYRSNGDKLVENWVIIDLPHWLAMQGLDVLARMRQLLGLERLGE